MKKFSVADDNSYRTLRGAELLSVCCYSDNEWWVTTDSDFIIVKYNKNIVYMGWGESEYESRQILPVLINDLPITKTSFINIMDKMKWTCDEDDLWLG